MTTVCEILRVMLIILAIAIIIRSEVETWPLRCALYEKIFNNKTKTEKRLRVLIITKSLWNIQALFVALQNKYKDHKCVYFTQDRFDKWILFENDENWTLISYYSKLIRQNEINYNEYDKIIFDINLPEDFIKEVTNKVKDRSTIRVCDLKTAINKVGGY